MTRSVLSVLLLFSLISCGKKAPPERPEPQENQINQEQTNQE